MPDTPLLPQETPITDPSRLLPERRSSVGPVIGIIIILGLLVFGAFYIWGQRLNEKRAEQAALQMQSSTTTLPDIIRISTGTAAR